MRVFECGCFHVGSYSDGLCHIVFYIFVENMCEMHVIGSSYQLYMNTVFWCILFLEI